MGQTQSTDNWYIPVVELMQSFKLEVPVARVWSWLHIEILLVGIWDLLHTPVTGEMPVSA